MPPSSISSSTFSVDIIPPEVWALVFEFLGLHDLRRSAALVCRAWHAVATDQRTVARLFWRHRRDPQRRDRQRPTWHYADAQLRDRASSASALPSPPEIIHLHFGQAGCELGLRYWERVCGEVGVRASDGGLALSGSHHQWPPLHSHFREASPGGHSLSSSRFVPRAVLVDRLSSGSVLDTANAKRLRSMVCPDNDLMEGEAVDERTSRLVEVVRKELERADFVDGFLMFLQLGEMGELERELLLACGEEWPHIVSMAAAVMPPIDAVSDLVRWDVARTLQLINDCASMAVLLDGTPRPNDPTTYDLLADAFSGATHPLRFGRTAARGAAVYSLQRMTTELVPYPFRLLTLSHVPMGATRSDEPTPAIAIADVVESLLRHRASCLSGEAPLGRDSSVCHAAFAAFQTNPAAGRQAYGEVEAAVRARVRQGKRSYGVLASVASSAPFGGATQPITLSGGVDGQDKGQHWMSGSMLSNSNGVQVVVSHLLERVRGQQRTLDLEDTETLSYLDDVATQWYD